MNRYILGGYGSTRTLGLDVIRLEERNYDNTEDVYFRLPPPWYKYARSSGIQCGYDLTGENPSDIGMGLPEVCGGGDAWTGPVYPYDKGDGEDGIGSGQYIFGAPDGHPDGVIIIATSGADIKTWDMGEPDEK